MEEPGTPAGDDTIREWMDDREQRLRKIHKVIAEGRSPDRDASFRNFARVLDRYRDAGNPVFSVDTKAKEFQGRPFRRGRVRCSRAFEALDHDFPSWADGVIIPHGIYDPVRNRGQLNIGLSHDATPFACDSLLRYGNRIGRQGYRAADSILLPVDCGGSNSATKYLFKHDWQQVANEIGIEIRVAHYPSYCSKYSPIERRPFPHVPRACTGMPFDALDRAVELMRQTGTSTGLKTTVNVIRRLNETGRHATLSMIDAIRSTVTCHNLLPKWNYTLTPK